MAVHHIPCPPHPISVSFTDIPSPLPYLPPGLKRLGRLMQFRPSRSKAPPRTTAVAVLDAGGAEDLLRAVVEGHKVAARAGEVGGATGAGDEGGTTTMDE